MTNFELNPQNMTYSVGGTVQASGGYYVERQADGELLALCLAGEFAYVLTARQMGKSSLMIRTAERLRQEEGPVTPVIVDLQAIGTPQDREEWYFGFVLAVAEQLEVGAGLGTDLYDWWDAQRGVGITQRLTRFFQQVVLREVVGRVVVFVDEIDSTLTLDYTDDFFIAIRYCFTARAENPEFKRLSFVLLGVATPGDLIIDKDRTPFNIGKRVQLTDFTRKESKPLLQGLQLPPGQKNKSEEVLDQILSWTGGHPYLTQRFFAEAQRNLQNNHIVLLVDHLIDNLFLQDAEHKIKQDTNLRFVQQMLFDLAPKDYEIKILRIYGEILKSSKNKNLDLKINDKIKLVVANLLTIPINRGALLAQLATQDDAQSIPKSHLKLSGIIKVNEYNQLIVRNKIYETVFNQTWLRQQLPSSGWKRYKFDFFVFAIITAVSGFIGCQLQEKIRLQQQVTTVTNLLRTSKSSQALAVMIDTYDKAKQNRLNDAEFMANINSSLLSALQQASLKNIILKEQQDFTAIALSEHKILISGDRNGNIQKWDLDGKSLDNPFSLFSGSIPGSAVESLAISPNGEILVAGSKGGTIKLWDLKDNQEKQLKFPITNLKSVKSLAFSPDGQNIVSGHADGSIRLWDLEGNPIGQPFQGHTDDVNAVAFSPNGSTIVSGSADKTVRIWNLKGQEIHKILNLNTVRSVAFSPDGTRIASGSDDRTVRLWDLEGKQIGQPFRGHTNYVTSVAFSPDGATLASGGGDGTIRLWDLAGNLINQPFQGATGSVKSVIFSFDGKTIVSLGDDQSTDDKFMDDQLIQSIKLWDLSSNPTLRSFKDNTDEVVKNIIALAFGPDSTTIVGGLQDGRVMRWDREGSWMDISPNTDKSPIIAVASQPQHNTIVSASQEGKISFWGLEKLSQKDPLTLGGSVKSMVLSPDGTELIAITQSNSGSSSPVRKLQLWNLQDDGSKPLSGGGDSMISLAWSPKGSILASGSEDNTVKLWSLQSDAIKPMGQPFEGHTGDVTSVAFSPDGEIIATGSKDKTIRLWDLRGNPIGQPWQGHTDTITSVVFSPNGNRILSSSADGTVREWPASPEAWFQIGCDRLRYHPLFTRPETEIPNTPDLLRITQEARQACQTRVWDRP